jgi:hypothetical protein
LDRPHIALEFRLELPAVELTASGATTDPNYRALRDARLTETFSVSNFTLQRDAGSLTLHSGTISFAPAVLGRVTLGVFVGEGEFTLKPAHWTEARHLKRILNRESIAESFRQAVLCFTDNTYQEVRAAGRAVAIEPRASQITCTALTMCLAIIVFSPKSIVVCLLSSNQRHGMRHLR